MQTRLDQSGHTFLELVFLFFSERENTKNKKVLNPRGVRRLERSPKRLLMEASQEQIDDMLNLCVLLTIFICLPCLPRLSPLVPPRHDQYNGLPTKNPIYNVMQLFSPNYTMLFLDQYTWHSWDVI